MTGPDCFEVIPIGMIHSPYKIPKDAPRQGRFSDEESVIEIYEPFVSGLRDVEREKHLIVLYWLDRADRTALTATPPHTGIEHGVFATRSPHRPNPIGLSVADLVRRDNNKLVVHGLDALDGTPVVDIKCYSPGLDCIPE
ncbi:tRNA (N6-threonylcarbamoyladenosine(37)-N6)-methyltransferase TrmO [Methanoregula sp.]|uniref:tRNA (N6-threonylcarbamoyladenosine(37)-N6)-methyltransferase TrmO n=1 Tax=Methanoregula sp. TaxID=2052170 RepID=UPI00356994AB